MFVRSAEAGSFKLSFGYLACKFVSFTSLYAGTVVFSNTVGRLHVLHLFMIYFTCLAMWLGRHFHLFTVCYVSGTRLATARHPATEGSF